MTERMRYPENSKYLASVYTVYMTHADILEFLRGILGESSVWTAPWKSNILQPVVWMSFETSEDLLSFGELLAEEGIVLNIRIYAGARHRICRALTYLGSAESRPGAAKGFDDLDRELAEA